MSSLFLNHDVNILGFFFSNDVFECWRQREKDIQRVGERRREKKGNQIKLRMINRNNKKNLKNGERRKKNKFQRFVCLFVDKNWPSLFLYSNVSQSLGCFLLHSSDPLLRRNKTVIIIIMTSKTTTATVAPAIILTWMLSSSPT